MSSNFGGIPPLTSELAALDQFKKSFIREYSKYLMTCCQVSDRCPLGYLFFALYGLFFYHLASIPFLFGVICSKLMTLLVV